MALDRPPFPSTVPAGRNDRRLALTVVVVSALIFLACVPFARRPLPEIWAFIPAYEAALVVGDLITASILFMQFWILRSGALLVLGCGYLFTALMAVSHVLTFPGSFSESGLLDAGPHSTAWLYLFWHAGLPLSVIAYAVVKNRDEALRRSDAFIRAIFLLALGAVVAAVCILTLLATVGQNALPPLTVGNRAGQGLFVGAAVDCALALAALLVLGLQRSRTLLDLWLIVVLCALLMNVALGALFNAGRFDLGFYAGRIYGLVAANLVLLVLLHETAALYARAVEWLEAEREGHKQELQKRLHVEAALVEHEVREQLFGAAVDSSQDAIVTKTLAGMITGWNPAAERLFGYAADEVVGKSIDMMVPEEQRTELHDILARIGRGCRVEHHETVRLAKSGRRIEVSLSISPIKSPSGEIVGACKIARDMTDKKRLERMKDEFVATVSHELRTPVTTIAGPLGLLVGGAAGEMPDKVKMLVTMAHANSERLARLVNDILDIDRIEAGRMRFDFKQVETKRIVKWAIEANRQLSEQFGVPARLDENAIDASVQTDPDRLMQVLGHLLSNAVKFSPSGEEVVVFIERQGAYVRVGVRDRGSGIPEEFKNLIFEKFAQVDASDARRKGGSGLGLSIVRQTMLQLGGRVGHFPAPAGGTVFYVDLPCEHSGVSEGPPATVRNVT